MSYVLSSLCLAAQGALGSRDMKSTLQFLLRNPVEADTRNQEAHAFPALLTVFVPRRAFQHELCARKRSGDQPDTPDLSFSLFLISGPIYNSGQRASSCHIPIPCHPTRTKPLSHFLKNHGLQKGHARKRCQGTLAVTFSHMMSQNGNLI